MRLLLLGAFPYPHYQGSQVYFQEQAIALREAGAEVEFLTYADRVGEAEQSCRDDEPEGISTPSPNRALDGFRVHRSPRWTAPRSLRSGPSLAKPMGDLGLARSLRHLLASQDDDAKNDARASMRYDAILAHNAEAALVALAATSKPRPPIIYCVHTLLGHELSTYAKRLTFKGFSGAALSTAKPLGGRVIDRAGRAIDRWIARHVDGWIALTQASSRVMHQHAAGPGALIPPPIPDLEPGISQTEAAEIRAVCERHGLEPNRFFLYSGNLDPYQQLEIIAAAAALIDKRGLRPAIKIVLASHDPAIRAWVSGQPGLEACIVESPDEMQALLRVARASLVLRQAVGGFPIKLANSLAAGTPALAFHGREWGLVDGENSLVCDAQNPAESLANMIANLAVEDARALRLSRGARALYLKQHQPGVVATETLALVERVRRFSPCPSPCPSA